MKLSIYAPKYKVAIDAIPFKKYAKIKKVLYYLWYPFYIISNRNVVARCYAWIDTIWINPRMLNNYSVQGIASIIDHEYQHAILYKQEGVDAMLGLDKIEKTKEKRNVIMEI